MLKRKIDLFLNEWLNNKNRLPLIVKGARQIGKTTSIMEFANKNYESVVNINFINNKEYKNVFESNDVNNIISYLSILNPNFKFIFINFINITYTMNIYLYLYFTNYILHVLFFKFFILSF